MRERVGAAGCIDESVLETLESAVPDGGLVARVIRAFLDSTGQYAASLREATASGDAEGLSQAAHALKSSSAQVGALELSALCKKLEMAGRTNAIADACELVAPFDREFDAVLEALAAKSFELKG